MRSVAIGRVLLTIAIIASSAEDVYSDDPLDFFERQVRPLLVAKCWECHGDEAPEGGLRLTTRQHVLKGGQSGPSARRGTAIPAAG